MANNVLTIGMPVSLTGRYALQGQQCRTGLECYARDVNAVGGILLRGAGRRLPVQLKICDDESKVVRAQALAEQLLEEHRADLLLGPYGSGSTRAVAEVADRHAHVLWNHSGAADAGPRIC